MTTAGQVFQDMGVSQVEGLQCDHSIGHMPLSTFQFVGLRLMEYYANYHQFVNVMDLAFTAAPKLPVLGQPGQPKP